jgi:PhzF family phenazine biosynthesis protein
MQRVAAEINASETAFLVAVPDGFMLRWFSPAAEVDLCGHGTLASAHILWETGATDAAKIRFHTKSGLLTAERDRDGIVLDFPAEPAADAAMPAVLKESLNITFRYVGKNRMDYLVEAADEAAVRSVKPDFEKLKKLGARGVIVTARADAHDVDFVSRCFFPGLGINEDPVTGSAHCCLGPYWGSKLGKTEMTARQLSKRGGWLRVELAVERVLLRGHAVTTISGRLQGDQ